ncbi:MAG: MurR/RpiR family transcriptional regulator [Culicoidibacterales bacterium]
MTRLIVLMDMRRNSNDIYYHIAKTILENSNRVPTMGIEELAYLCFTSPATISRFCKKVSLSSFIELKQAIQQANQQNIDEVSFTAAEISAISVNSQLIAAKTFPLSIHAMQATYNSLDMVIIEKVITAITKANHIAIFGSIFSQLVARDCQYKFLRLGKFTTAFTDPSDQNEDALNLTKHDLAIFFSVSGAGPGMKGYCQSALAKKATTVAITNKKNSSLAQIADFVIEIGGTESDFSHSSISGRIACMSIVDLLYTGVAYKNITKKG